MIFADPPYGTSEISGRRVTLGKSQRSTKAFRTSPKSGSSTSHTQKVWLALCQQVLKPNGTIWVSGTRHIIHIVGYAMQMLGFKKFLQRHHWEAMRHQPVMSLFYSFNRNTLVGRERREEQTYIQLCRDAGRSRWKADEISLADPATQQGGEGVRQTSDTKATRPARRCIRAATNPGDFILDPFAGSSTTGVAALELGRRYCGIEKETEYVQLSEARLKDV